MVVALLAVIVILLLPGGAHFIARLCTVALYLIGCVIAYAIWGPGFVWAVATFAVVIVGAFVHAFLSDLRKPRKRFLTGGRKPSRSTPGKCPYRAFNDVKLSLSRLRAIPALTRPSLNKKDRKRTVLAGPASTFCNRLQIFIPCRV
jgi:hypothetical protein